MGVALHLKRYTINVLSIKGDIALHLERYTINVLSLTCDIALHLKRDTMLSLKCDIALHLEVIRSGSTVFNRFGNYIVF